jgi:hypothetical protein
MTGFFILGISSLTSLKNHSKDSTKLLYKKKTTEYKFLEGSIRVYHLQMKPKYIEG